MFQGGRTLMCLGCTLHWTVLQCSVIQGNAMDTIQLALLYHAYEYFMENKTAKAVTVWDAGG